MEGFLIASQLAPILDRTGRLLIDLAPQMAMIGGPVQTNHANTANASLVSNISTITNESSQQQQNQRVYAFQVESI